MNDVDNSTTIYHRTFSVRNSKLLFLDFGYTHWGSITVITIGDCVPVAWKQSRPIQKQMDMPLVQ